MLTALAGWLHKHHGWRVEEDHILRAPNILNSLAIAASIFTRPGDGVIVQPPVFFDFFDVLRENHRKIITNPLLLENGHYSMDYDDLESKAADSDAKMIYLCNPHNPVARVWNERELRKLGEICIRHNVIVVSDEMHGDLVFQGSEFIPFASLGTEYAEHCITCVSPAKAFNIASCCSSFTIISEALKRKAFKIENSRLTVNKNNAFANVAMEAAYTHGEEWLQAVLRYIEGNVELVRSRLSNIPGVELIEPEGTFFYGLISGH